MLPQGLTHPMSTPLGPDGLSLDTFRVLVEELLTGVYLVQGQRMLYCNPRLCEMFGYTNELRSMSTGRASSVMEPLKYAPVPTQVLNAILEEVG